MRNWKYRCSPTANFLITEASKLLIPSWRRVLNVVGSVRRWNWNEHRAERVNGVSDLHGGIHLIVECGKQWQSLLLEFECRLVKQRQPRVGSAAAHVNLKALNRLFGKSKTSLSQSDASDCSRGIIQRKAIDS